MAKSENQQNVSKPAGYDSFESENINVRSTQVQQEETKSLRVPNSLKVKIGSLIKDIREWKVNGRLLEGVALIKASDGIQNKNEEKGRE